MPGFEPRSFCVSVCAFPLRYSPLPVMVHPILTICWTSPKSWANVHSSSYPISTCKPWSLHGDRSTDRCSSFISAASSWLPDIIRLEKPFVCCVMVKNLSIILQTGMWENQPTSLSLLHLCCARFWEPALTWHSLSVWVWFSLKAPQTAFLKWEMSDPEENLLLEITQQLPWEALSQWLLKKTQKHWFHLLNNMIQQNDFQSQSHTCDQMQSRLFGRWWGCTHSNICTDTSKQANINLLVKGRFSITGLVWGTHLQDGCPCSRKPLN